MRQYAFDVKIFAVIRVFADSRKQAEDVLTVAVNAAELKLNSPSGKSLDAAIFVDDVGFPYLIEVDGIDVDNDESEADDFESSA
jgi:hypothetical protein